MKLFVLKTLSTYVSYRMKRRDIKNGHTPRCVFVLPYKEGYFQYGCRFLDTPVEDSDVRLSRFSKVLCYLLLNL